MTGTLPSWSPLNDPRLAARIQAGLHSERPDERKNAQRDLYFLERYAWQEYPAKCGRWRTIDDPWALTGGEVYSGPWTKKKWYPDFNWVLLLDPSNRQPMAVHRVDWWKLEHKEAEHLFRNTPDNRLAVNPRDYIPVDENTASVWFAGEPRVCGMFTSAGDGGGAVFGYRHDKGGFENWEGGADFERFAPMVAAEPFADLTSREYGPWIADSPEPPPRPKRFAFLRG